MSWFPTNFKFLATPKNLNQNSPLLTSQQNWNTLRWLMFGFLWFLWNRKSLSVGRGLFVVLDKLKRNLLRNGFVGDQKSSWKFFDGNSRKFIESTHLCWNCLMFLWISCLWGSSRQFAVKFGPEMRKRNDLLSFTIFLLFCSFFYRISFQKVLEFSVNFWRWLRQLCDSLELIKTFLCVELHVWFGWSLRMKWWNFFISQCAGI